MSRLQMRDNLLDTFDLLVELLQTILAVAAQNVDTIMPGHTHLSQGQPITLAHYLFSIFDGMYRGLRQLELAYHDTNLNSGGCGSCSGITWPVDRLQLTRLLGMEDVLESTYDCEAAQDHSMSVMFALTNLMLLISKSSIDGNIWGMEEVDMLHNDPGWCGQSSFMPHKCNTGSQFERSRIMACDVIAEMMRGVALNKGEPHADMLPMMEVPKAAIRAMLHAQLAISYYNGLLKSIVPQREQMLKHVRDGLSCATEIVVYMVKELGYGGRRAHRIVATFVRLARIKNLRAYETTGELLDEAADFVEEPRPGIATEMLRELLDPEKFIAAHTNIGGTAPAEAKRMIERRKQQIEEAQKRLQNRKGVVEEGRRMLKKSISGITGRTI
jgi:argininosuccinate lyase